jgi:apolipoprotein N-acyltransferase
MTRQNDQPHPPSTVSTRPVLGFAKLQKRTTSIVGKPDRLPSLWLVLGLLLFAFSTSRWMIGAAAWLYPIFLLRFVRTQPLWRGIRLVLLGTALVLVIELQGQFELPAALYAVAVLGVSVLSTLPFLIDRALAPRLGGLLGTLVFPLAVTSLGYLHIFAPVIGSSMGDLAYTQYGNLPLLQLVSVTGLWGIDLLICWLASLVNWAWERNFAWPWVRGMAAVYATLLAAILVGGGARLTFFPSQARTVQVAGVSPSQALEAAVSRTLNRQIPQQTWATLVSRTATAAKRSRARQTVATVFGPAYAAENTELFALSEQQAHAGAKIIVWPEGAAGVPQEDESALVARASALARSTGTYLDLGLLVLLQQTGPSHLFLDQSVLVGQSGSVLWRYEKIHPVPGTESATTVAGPDRVPTVQTPYGRLSTVVCFDASYPGTLRQAGQAGADILLVPSNDWRETAPYDTQVATFRAIENGYALVRQASHGLAITVDDEGNMLAATDAFTTDPQVMVASVPMHGVHTIYATIGDLFAWLAIGSLLALIGMVVFQRKPASGLATDQQLATGQQMGETAALATPTAPLAPTERPSRLAMLPALTGMGPPLLAIVPFTLGLWALGLVVFLGGSALLLAMRLIRRDQITSLDLGSFALVVLLAVSYFGFGNTYFYS